MVGYTVIYCATHRPRPHVFYKIRCLVILRISLVTAIVSLQLCIPPYDVYNFAITEVSGRYIISPSVIAFIALQLKVHVSINTLHL